MKARGPQLYDATLHESRSEGTLSKPIHELDKPRTFKDAAIQLSVGYHIVQRAARRGLVPTYQLGSSRRYVTLRDFLELMKRDTNR